MHSSGMNSQLHSISVHGTGIMVTIPPPPKLLHRHASAKSLVTSTKLMCCQETTSNKINIGIML